MLWTMAAVPIPLPATKLRRQEGPWRPTGAGIRESAARTGLWTLSRLLAESMGKGSLSFADGQQERNAEDSKDGGYLQS